MKPPIIAASIFDRLTRTNFQFYRRVVPDDYTHTITAFGGYDTAQMVLGATKTEAEDWLEDGLGRHIEIYGSALDPIWEGVIDEVRTNVASLSVTQGPLMNVGNRVYVMYSPVENTGTGEAAGGQTVTPYQDDTISQGIHGVLPTVISGGTVTAANAAYIRDKYLADNAWPKATKSFNNSGGRDVTVTLTCKGYQHWLNYPYNAAAGVAIQADAKIAAALAATPNGAWLTYDTANINSNALGVSPLEDQYRSALTVIKEVVAKGDTSNARWLFQVLNNRAAYYYAAPTDVEYMTYIEDRGLVLRSTSQAAIEPWRMRPGFWLAFLDFMVGRSVPATATSADPRLMFVEKVTYRAPFGLQLQGGNTDEIYQVLARYGLGGMA